MQEVNPNANLQVPAALAGNSPASPQTNPTQQSYTPGALPGTLSGVSPATPQNSVGPGNMPSPPTMGSVAGTVQGPQTSQTQAAPTVSYMANATAAGLPGAPQIQPPPTTAAKIGQSFQNFQGTVQGTQAPASYPAAQIQQGTQPTSGDPIFDSLTSSMAPIMNSLNQVISDINNPAITGQSLQQQYDQLSQQNNLPKLNAELMNYQNIMNGTQDDISAEITAAGGTATQSQVLAMTSARNTVILKQYNALATQYSAAQTNVQNMMQYASSDQQTALARESQTASVTEAMDSIYQNMIQMGMTMQQNNSTNYRAILTAGGPDSLAESVAGNPTQQAIAETSLGLAPGTLTNPQQVAAWQADTYKTQQIQLANYRDAVYGYNAGYGPPPASGSTGTGTSSGGGDGGNSATSPAAPAPATSYAENQLVRPSWMSPSIPIYGSASDMKAAATAGKATIDPGTNNYVVPGVGYYQQQSDGSYALKSAIPPDPTQTQSQYQQIQSQISNAQSTPASYGPNVTRKWSLSAAAAVKNYINLPIYQTLSGSSQYLAKIEAAQKDPGSVTDVDLLDSYINLSKGTGQVTEAQISGITGGSSVSDQASVLLNHVQNGGILSENQRQAITQLSQDVYQNYQALYQPVYVEAVSSMKAQGIPPQFWNVMPDLDQLSQLGQSATNTQ